MSKFGQENLTRRARILNTSDTNEKNILYGHTYYWQAQARECLFEKLQLQARECARGELRDDLDMCLDFAQEAAQCAHTYHQLYQKV